MGLNGIKTSEWSDRPQLTALFFDSLGSVLSFSLIDVLSVV